MASLSSQPKIRCPLPLSPVSIALHNENMTVNLKRIPSKIRANIRIIWNTQIEVYNAVSMTSVFFFFFFFTLNTIFTARCMDKLFVVHQHHGDDVTCISVKIYDNVCTSQWKTNHSPPRGRDIAGKSEGGMELGRVFSSEVDWVYNWQSSKMAASDYFYEKKVRIFLF